MLILVVGPSGAGKDTLIDGARAMLDNRAAPGHPPVRFVRRVITRPADPAGEAHECVTEPEFRRRQNAGTFALSWQAHGLYYGIPGDIAHDLGRGAAVVANVSRSVVADAAARFPVAVIEVSAAADVLAGRLAARGREDATDVARRLSRAIELKLPVERQCVVNNGTIEDGVRKMLAAIGAVSGQGASP